jgi:hypothetical protein
LKALARAAASWCVRTDRGWVHYKAVETAVLERAWGATPTPTAAFVIGAHPYQVQFDRTGAGNHIQVNTALHTRREVVRIPGVGPTPSTSGDTHSEAAHPVPTASIQGECDVCMEEDKLLLEATPACKHPPSCCKTCLQEQIRTDIYAKGGTFEIGCPLPSCNVTLECV